MQFEVQDVSAKGIPEDQAPEATSVEQAEVVLRQPVGGTWDFATSNGDAIDASQSSTGTLPVAHAQSAPAGVARSDSGAHGVASTQVSNSGVGKKRPEPTTASLLIDVDRSSQRAATRQVDVQRRYPRSTIDGDRQDHALVTWLASLAVERRGMKANGWESFSAEDDKPSDIRFDAVDAVFETVNNVLQLLTCHRS
jgi:hypothetical protein